MFLDCSWTLSRKKKKRKAWIRAEDSIQATKGKWLGETLWEFTLFEMQIPQRAERAGETGVQGSVLLRGWARAGVRVLNDNTGCIEILLAQSSLCGTSPLVTFSLFSSKCGRKERETWAKYDRFVKYNSFKFYWFKCNLVQNSLYIWEVDFKLNEQTDQK